ncbi:MAG: MATE family efflux transporter [Myxococcales bacterium]|nr:MATE family efflux transporter [Myxococcales bacterium]
MPDPAPQPPPSDGSSEHVPAVSLGIWELAGPAIAANLLHSTVGIVDGVAVGTLGASALAAATAGERIFFILQAVLMAISAATTALVARAWGAGDRAEAEHVARASLILCIAVATAAGALGLLIAPQLAAIFQLDDATRELTTTYIRWLMLFNPSFAVFFALGAAVRAAGDTRTPLWIGGLANVLNVALLFPLVFGAFGFEGLGIKGAALSGGGAFTIGSAVFLWRWWSGKLLVKRGGSGALTRARILRIARIGTPAGLEQLVFQVGFVLFLFIVSFYGTEPYAAYGVGVRILSFSFVVGSGFSIAASTLVGQHLGARDPSGASRSGWRSMGISIAAMSIFGLLIVLAAEPIARFMIDDDEVVRLSVVFIYILGSVQPLMAIEFTLAGALRGAGDTRFPLYTVLAGMLLVRSTLAVTFSLLDLPVEWIFAALIGDYIVKASLLTWRFHSGRWQRALLR